MLYLRTMFGYLHYPQDGSMSSRNFSSAKQTVKPPQRGIFPLDHESECKPHMQVGCASVILIDDLFSYLSLLLVNVEADFHRLVSTIIKQKYISCLNDQKDKHYLCRELSKEYLQCRMDRQLMASEDLDKVRLHLLNRKVWSVSL